LSGPHVKPPSKRWPAGAIGEKCLSAASFFLRRQAAVPRGNPIVGRFCLGCPSLAYLSWTSKKGKRLRSLPADMFECWRKPGIQTQDRGVATPPAAKLLAAQKLAKGRPTLSRLLSQVPGSEASSAGRAKTRWRSDICPASSALLPPAPALSLDGGMGKNKSQA
jgi:hypothetical protein